MSFFADFSFFSFFSFFCFLFGVSPSPPAFAASYLNVTGGGSGVAGGAA